MKVLWGGILITILGNGYDWYWHVHQGGTHAGSFLPLPHALIVFGLIVSLVGAIRSYRRSADRQRTVLGAAVISGCVGLLGQLWDETLHYREVHEGSQMVVAHLAADLGFLLMLVTAGVAVWLAKY
jgi:hypothetical protein